MTNDTKQRIILSFFIIIGLFSIFQTKTNRFITEQAFKENLTKQADRNSKILAQLRTHNITENSESKLEYFFYTNTQQKAKSLSKELEHIGYHDVKYGASAGDQTLFLINGWSNNIKMSIKDVSDWTKKMCEIGYKCDGDFDGWGTNTK